MPDDTPLYYGIPSNSGQEWDFSADGFCMFCQERVPESELGEHNSRHNVKVCRDKPLEERTFTRKDQLKQRISSLHKASPTHQEAKPGVYGSLNDALLFWKREAEASHFHDCLEALWCGLCRKNLPTWKERMDCVGKHFGNGRKMTAWQPYGPANPLLRSAVSDSYLRSSIAGSERLSSVPDFEFWAGLEPPVTTYSPMASPRHSHSFAPEVPRQLPSQRLFRMLQSNADRHSGYASHFANLSDPPDLYSSLQDEPCNPPDSDLHPADADTNSIPQVQELRFPGDLYTPVWVRGHGNEREGWCGLCKPGRWLVLKNSAFWYDKSFTHGVSAATGRAFEGPIDTRRMEGNLELWEGLCSSCREWIALVSSKKKGTAWFRHAYKVSYDTLH